MTVRFKEESLIAGFDPTLFTTTSDAMRVKFDACKERRRAGVSRYASRTSTLA